MSLYSRGKRRFEQYTEGSENDMKIVGGSIASIDGTFSTQEVSIYSRLDPTNPVWMLELRNPTCGLPERIVFKGLKDEESGRKDQEGQLLHNNEMTIYKALQKLWGNVVPQFYGETLWNVRTDSEEITKFGIALEYVDGVPLRSLCPSNMSQQNQRSLVQTLISHIRQIFDENVVWGDDQLNNIIICMEPKDVVDQPTEAIVAGDTAALSAIDENGIGGPFSLALAGTLPVSQDRYSLKRLKQTEAAVVQIRVRLIDFGLSNISDNARKLTQNYSDVLAILDRWWER